ncbi:MAG: ABC transporter substrate-binding protein [Elusimicrobia bacterium]|nr:ABC transporter substrate-binding protein [Elusimicrobiota bacterium]
MKRALFVAAAIFASRPLAAAADAPPSDATAVREVVENSVNGTIAVLKDKANDRDARRRKVFTIIDSAVDFPLMGKLTLGRTHWSQFDSAQQKDFIASFCRVVKDSVFDKVEIYTNETVEFAAPAPADNGKYQMSMDVLSKGQHHKAVFKLFREGGAWKVYDLEADGISMVRIYAAQYDQVLQKGAPADLLAKLKNKALAVPDEFKALGETTTPGKK